MYEYVVFILFLISILFMFFNIVNEPNHTNYTYVPSIINERLTNLSINNPDKFHSVVDAMERDGFNVVNVTNNGSVYYYILP